jgi:hypothetical protein
MEILHRTEKPMLQTEFKRNNAQIHTAITKHCATTARNNLISWKGKMIKNILK